MFLIKKEKRTLRLNNPFYRAPVKLFNTSPGLVSYLETCRMWEKKLMVFLKSTAGRWSQDTTRHLSRGGKHLQRRKHCLSTPFFKHLKQQIFVALWQLVLLCMLSPGTGGAVF